MSFISRLSRVARANVNALVSSTEDPGKVVDQALMDMESELMSLRQAVARAVTSQQHIETQLWQARDQADRWCDRAYAALQEGNEELAREALTRSKPYEETVQALSRQLEFQAVQVEDLKRNLLALEGKLAQAQAKRKTLKARVQSAQAQRNFERGGISTDSAMNAFERMEEKVEVMEARSATVSQPFPTLSGDWESEDVEARLQQLKARLRNNQEK